MDSYEEDNNSTSNPGLLRFRSAPSSVFNNWTDSDLLESESYERKPRILLTNSPNGYSGHLPPQYPKQNNLVQPQHSNSGQSTAGGSGGRLSLSRQSSSPAAFFNNLNITQNGYTVVRGIGSLRVGNDTNGDESIACPREISRLSMSGHLPQIPEIGKEISTDGFSLPSWTVSNTDASHLSETDGLSGRPSLLSHHLSMPNTSAEMDVIEKLFHYQDTVPCKVRAKRGCATHPRSIAERVRRNRISERMRKLQDLVPNMDKQTNTSDMLDFAVDYIKKLQDQHKALSDNRARCKCVNVQHSMTNQQTT